MKQSDVNGMILGYLASRFNEVFLKDLHFSSFAALSRYVAKKFQINVNSVKNWRDEFDGLDTNPYRQRKGWVRKPTPSRVYLKLQLDKWNYIQLLSLAKTMIGQSNDFNQEEIIALFNWAYNGHNDAIKEAVKAIGEGIISFSESQEIFAIEGGRRLMIHLRFERKAKIAQEAVRRHVHAAGPVCKLCAMDFSNRYQLSSWEHCLEAHHITPLSFRLKAANTRLDDFLIICPTCHRVIHKKRAFDQASIESVLR